MARVRSPNYPAFGLPDAIARIKTIHAAEQHLAAPKEVIAKHLGYGGMNGASIKAISALNKYGLLEEVNGDKVKVSPLAISILYPSTPLEKRHAIHQAGFKPQLFAEIAAEWAGQQPSDENLRSYLVRKNFAADAVDKVIQSYRETMDLVTQESGGYSPPNAPAAGKEPEKPLMFQNAQRPPLNAGLPPMTVAFDGKKLEISAVLADSDQVEQLIKALNATKALLPAKASDVFE